VTTCFEGIPSQMGEHELEKIMREGTQKLRIKGSRGRSCEKSFREGINAIITQQVHFWDPEFLL